MKNFYLSTQELGERSILAILFLSIGSLIYFVFSPMRPLLDRGTIERSTDYLGRMGLIVILLAVVLLVRKSKRLEKYGQVLLGLLIMVIAALLDRIISVYLLKYLNVDGNTPSGYTILKLNECFIVASVVVSLTLLALAWGAIMQKTDSIWASILFHAGMDIPIMLGIFSNL